MHGDVTFSTWPAFVATSPLTSSNMHMHTCHLRETSFERSLCWKNVSAPKNRRSTAVGSPRKGWKRQENGHRVPSAVWSNTANGFQRPCAGLGLGSLASIMHACCHIHMLLYITYIDSHANVSIYNIDLIGFDLAVWSSAYIDNELKNALIIHVILKTHACIFLVSHLWLIQWWPAFSQELEVQPVSHRILHRDGWENYQEVGWDWQDHRVNGIGWTLATPCIVHQCNIYKL